MLTSNYQLTTKNTTKPLQQAYGAVKRNRLCLSDPPLSSKLLTKQTPGTTKWLQKVVVVVVFVCFLRSSWVVVLLFLHLLLLLVVGPDWQYLDPALSLIHTGLFGSKSRSHSNIAVVS